MNKLLISFENQDPLYTYGVEFGRILEKIERGDLTVNNNGFPIRIENRQNIESLCSVYDYIPSFGNEEFGWIEFIGIKRLTTEN